MTEFSGGSASIVAAKAPSIRSDGACLSETLAAIGSSGRGLDASALEKIRTDALDLLSQVANAYELEVATGEIGAHGTAKAGLPPPTKWCTGLLYGRVQSGKTMAMIALVAAAIDNGFRVIVVLTSDNVTLAAQTTERFRDALEPHGPLTRDALSPDEWITDDRHIAKHVATAGVVFVCSKNRARLERLNEFLSRIGAPDYPALILDDEADQATPDVNVAKRSRARVKNAPEPDPTAIHQAVVGSLRSTLRHHVFLQVTATPYALLLQTVGTALRPSFGRLLEPGAGYTGGDVFFDSSQITDDGLFPPLAHVDDDESHQLLQGTTDAPEGLRRAIAFFLVAATAQAVLDPDRTRAGQSFLCHTSQLRKEHRSLGALIKGYVEEIENAIVAGDEGLEPMRRLAASHTDLRKTCPDAPPLDELLPLLQRRLIGRKVVVVNSESDAVFGRSLNLIVGGNILGRGVTIENLLVTYYLREPKIGQMDTMLQHARMYGYRGRVLQYTRVFLPVKLAIRFQEIHRMETRLRRQLEQTVSLDTPIVLERTADLKVTRAGVIDPSYVDLFDAEDQRFPTYPEMWLKKGQWESIRDQIVGIIGESLPDKTDPSTPYSIDFDTLIQLVERFPYSKRESSMSWVPPAIARVLDRQRERCSNRAWLYVRMMSRRTTTFTGGALSGDEVSKLRKHGGPVFCAFWDRAMHVRCQPGEQPAGPYWYPTVVFDAGMPRVVVNVSPV